MFNLVSIKNGLHGITREDLNDDRKEEQLERDYLGRRVWNSTFSFDSQYQQTVDASL